MNGSSVCHLVGGGDFDAARFRPAKGDYVIACDSGRAHLEKIGRAPDLTVGDFDSYGGALPSGECVTVLPREKDETDMEYAAKIGLERGYRVFVLHGALGGKRLSHTLGNLSVLLLLKRSGAAARALGKGVAVGVIGHDETLCFEEDFTGYISFFSPSPSCRLSLDGFKYPFDGVIDQTATRTVSNEFPPPGAPHPRASAHGEEVFYVIEEY